MALGFGGHAHWRDMSEYLVHMTRLPGSLNSILRSKELRARNAYGAARRFAWLGDSQRVVCLSEIPLDHLVRLAERRGRFGVVLTRRLLTDRGALPVWYLRRGSLPQQTLFTEVKRLAFGTDDHEANHWVWSMTPFIDYPGVYETHGGSTVQYEWAWEREWRLRGSLSFQPADLAFVFAPESTHPAIADMWSEAGYGACPPLLDAIWPLEKVQQVAVREGL